MTTWTIYVCDEPVLTSHREAEANNLADEMREEYGEDKVEVRSAVDIFMSERGIPVPK